MSDRVLKDEQGHALVKKRRFGVVLPLVFLAAGGALGYYIWQNSKQTAEPVKEVRVKDYVPETFLPSEAQWANLKIAPVEAMAFRTGHASDGKIFINDYKTTPVFSPFSGRVTHIFVEPGAIVKQGTPLYAIEATEFVQAQNDLTAAVDALNKARAQLRLTEINAGRQRDLYQARGASKRDLEQAEADFTNAQNDLRSAEIGLDAVKKRLVILGKSLAEIDGLVSRASSISLEATVNAPIAGTVISRKVGVGQYLQAGASDPVFTIGDLSTVWLVANVRETDVPAIRLGQKVDVRVIAYPGRVFDAKITYLAPSIDPATHRLPVRAEVENPDFLLKPEMFANFTIYSSDEARAPAIPEEAIIYEGAEARVWVAAADHRLSSRQIKIGRTKDRMVEVLSGLNLGESVVAGGAIFIDRAVRSDISPAFSWDRHA